MCRRELMLSQRAGFAKGKFTRGKDVIFRLSEALLEHNVVYRVLGLGSFDFFPISLMTLY